MGERNAGQRLTLVLLIRISHTDVPGGLELAACETRGQEEGKEDHADKAVRILKTMSLARGGSPKHSPACSKAVHTTKLAIIEVVETARNLAIA